MMTNKKNNSIKIATWNVNSVRLRLPIFESWFAEESPDIILLQELKCVEEAFPYTFFEDLGYNCAVYGQKTFNGVAIISKFPIEDVIKGIDNFEDVQSRYIEAFTGGFRVASVYVPNGQEIGAPHFDYKLKFMAALKERMEVLKSYHEQAVIGGDYNIAPRDIDVFEGRKSEIFTTILERESIQSLINLGFYDAYTMLNDGQNFSWWDYRGGSFAKNLGMRIDHLLISPQVADQLQSVTIKKELRAMEKPSDHVPVICEVKNEIN